jgi:hypothetical protein
MAYDIFGRQIPQQTTINQFIGTTPLKSANVSSINQNIPVTNTSSSGLNQTTSTAQPVNTSPTTTTGPRIGDFLAIDELPATVTPDVWSQFTFNDPNAAKISYGSNIGYLQSPITGYKAILSNQYASAPKRDAFGQIIPSTTLYKQPTNYEILSYTDKNKEAATDELNAALNKALYYTTQSNILDPTSTVSTLRSSAINPAYTALQNKPAISTTGVSLLDVANQTTKDAALSSVASKYGMTPEELTNYYNQKYNLSSMLYDPNQANYQNILNAPDTIQKAVTGVIQDYTNFGRTGDNKVVVANNPPSNLTLTNGQATKSGNYYYYKDPATGSIMKTMDELVAKSGASGGPTDYWSLANEAIKASQGDLPAEAIALASFRGDPSKNVNANLGLEDFLPYGVNILTATNEQINAAQNALAEQKQLLQPWLDPKRYTEQQIAEKGGQGSVFDFKTSEKLPAPEGYSLVGTSPYMREFNTLANAGINPTKVLSSLTPENVYKQSLLNERGGLITNILESALLSVPTMGLTNPLSTLPGYLQTGIKGISGINSLLKGDYLGGLTNLGGAFGFNPLGDLTAGIGKTINDAVGSAFNLSPEMATTVTRGIMGGVTSAAMAALNDQDVLQALVSGAGTTLLANKINEGLATQISSPGLRNFISSNIAGVISRRLQGQSSALPPLFAKKKGGLASVKSLPNNKKTVNMGSVASLHPDLVRTLKSRNLI